MHANFLIEMSDAMSEREMYSWSQGPVSLAYHKDQKQGKTASLALTKGKTVNV